MFCRRSARCPTTRSSPERRSLERRTQEPPAPRWERLEAINPTSSRCCRLQCRSAMAEQPKVVSSKSRSLNFFWSFLVLQGWTERTSTPVVVRSVHHMRGCGRSSGCGLSAGFQPLDLNFVCAAGLRRAGRVTPRPRFAPARDRSRARRGKAAKPEAAARAAACGQVCNR